MAAHRDHEHRQAALVERRGADLAARARELLDTGETSMVATSGELQARLVRFRWGQSVLEISQHASAGPAYRSALMARMPWPRRRTPDDVRALTHRLAAHLALMGEEAEPG